MTGIRHTTFVRGLARCSGDLVRTSSYWEVVRRAGWRLAPAPRKVGQEAGLHIPREQQLPTEYRRIEVVVLAGAERIASLAAIGLNEDAARRLDYSERQAVTPSLHDANHDEGS